MTTGEKIRELRLSVGVSQRELAKAIGKSQSTLDRYEKNQQSIPCCILAPVAEVFGLPISELMEAVTR